MKIDYTADNEMSNAVLSNTLRKQKRKSKPTSKRKKKNCGCDT
jgi:hypothetical protein